MPPKQLDIQFAIVTEEKDGSLACSCSAFDQTGKACVHIRAARLQIAHGSVMDYIAISDAAVSRDLDKILLKLEKNSDSESVSSAPSSISDRDEDLNIKTPQKGYGVTPGRPAVVTPLCPSCTPIQFSQKKGPKPKPHNSLLPALLS
ncbi:hypothetical protein BDN70DRAFT_909176 [Pholiota conissans]|uniref:SWIM-type domain-containing protein n=1 Tax=Pholiota conissans TaxID=109636 RepID=A0A9P5YM19_9AGAR|nr:hypothetical protein BDN70DRAFT_909176 [Pholiota conissans]